MSLLYRTHNDCHLSNSSSKKKFNLSLNKNQFNLNKFIISYNSSPNKTIGLKTKNIFLTNEEKKFIKNNRLLTYLSNIYKNREHKYTIKDSTSITKNSDNTLQNFLSRNKTLNNKKNIFNTSSQRTITNNSIYPNYIKLNSLFNLPNLSKKNNQNNSLKTISSTSYIRFIKEKDKIKTKNSLLNKQRISLIKFNNIMKNKSKQIKNKEEIGDIKLSDINNYMKFKYYEDVNEKFERKLKDDLFIDKGVKNKLISMQKVGVFWKNVLEYCCPILYSDKFKYLKKSFSEDKKNINRRKANKIINKQLFDGNFNSQILNKKNKFSSISEYSLYS